MLLPILKREEIHISEWRACLGAQLRAATALGDADTVRGIRQAIAESVKMFT